MGKQIPKRIRNNANHINSIVAAAMTWNLVVIYKV